MPEGTRGQGGEQGIEGVRSSELRVSRVSTEGAEDTGGEEEERRPRVLDKLPDCTAPPDSDGPTRTSGGRADATTELGSGEDLRTESKGNKHVPLRAQ